MHILLTNDDGIDADGIRALQKELKKVATVTVVAPDSERSSVGHGITLAHPIWLKKVKRQGRFFGYGISGTPADCVKFGVKIILKKKPDMVVSGINLGPNDGCSVFYSGTIAGAREGAILGIPSIAVSLGTFVNPDFTYAARFTARLAKRVSHNKMPSGTFLSVNVPNKKSSLIAGIKTTRQGKVPIHGDFTKRQDPNLRTYYWMTGRLSGIEKDMDVDSYALQRGHITVTPIHCDLTDYSFLKVLRNWEF